MRPVRALYLFSQPDGDLLEIISGGEFMIQGIRKKIYDPASSPNQPPIPAVCDEPCCLRPMKKGSASEIPFRGYLCIHSLRPDDSLTILRWLCR
jgi:hypothetical protein